MCTHTFLLKTGTILCEVWYILRKIVKSIACLFLINNSLGEKWRLWNRGLLLGNHESHICCVYKVWKPDNPWIISCQVLSICSSMECLPSNLITSCSTPLWLLTPYKELLYLPANCLLYPFLDTLLKHSFKKYNSPGQLETFHFL